MRYLNEKTFIGISLAFLSLLFKQYPTLSLLMLGVGTALCVLGVIFAHGDYW